MALVPRKIVRLATTTTLGAALVLGAANAFAGGGVPPTRATPAQRELAQSRFLRGKTLQNAGKHEEALVELEASLDVVASPNTRLVIGRSHRELGHLVAAYAELGRAAVEAKELAREDRRYEKTAEAALAERAEIAPKLGFVEITITNAGEATTLHVGPEEVRRGGWNEPLPVAPGATTIRLDTPGREPLERTVTLEAGQKTSIALDAASAPEAAKATEPPALQVTTSDRTSLRPLAYVAGGVALVGLGTFLVAGSMANGTYADLETACGAGPCPAERKDDVSSGKTQQTFANIGLAVFAVSAAAGVTLFVLSRDVRPGAGQAARARVVARPSFVSLEGTF